MQPCSASRLDSEPSDGAPRPDGSSTITSGRSGSVFSDRNNQAGTHTFGAEWNSRASTRVWGKGEVASVVAMPSGRGFSTPSRVARSTPLADGVLLDERKGSLALKRPDHTAGLRDVERALWLGGCLGLDGHGPGVAFRASVRTRNRSGFASRRKARGAVAIHTMRGTRRGPTSDRRREVCGILRCRS